MSKTNKTVSIDFSGGLLLMFIILKLTGVIDWSWWWVLSPLWISFAIFLAILLFVGIVSLVALIIAAIASK